MTVPSKSRGLSLKQKFSYALSTARGVTIEYDLSGYENLVGRIRRLDYSGAADASISKEAAAARERVSAGAEPGEELVRVFALIAEVCRRELGMAPFDEQLIAGIAMHRGRLAQMQTGEGKTLAAVFPACLAAMAGKGVHVMTANDYLAHRDARWMRPVYERMGLRAAWLGEKMGAMERKAAYAADVTYLTAREAGFDYLRDQLRYDAVDVVQRGHAAAIVDEADFILIDEARIPLVIAGSCRMDDTDVRLVDRAARSLRPGVDYLVDREGRRVSIRPEAHPVIEKALGVPGIHEERGAEAFARMHAALHAHALLARDVDYVVKRGRIELVDGFTGRVADRRQWPYGVQAALEAKEGLEIGAEGRVYGSITIQHFMGLYAGLAAMTATAVPSAEELSGFYGLVTTVIPTVKPVARVDGPDFIYRTREEKMRALVTEITGVHRTGRPMLVGTASVKESEELAARLAPAGVRAEVLNAKNDEREAELISEAGRLGAVTISTNMAGRGVDIKLAAFDAVRGDAENGRRPEYERVMALGGLYVIGTDRHESRRVDDQLRGRSGRQGEPGSSRFFISLEDPLFERFGVREFLPKSCRGGAECGGVPQQASLRAPPPRAASDTPRAASDTPRAASDAPAHRCPREGAAAEGSGPIADRRVLSEVDRAQSIIEAQNHQIRRMLRKYSLLVELDRRRVRGMRDAALLRGELPPAVRGTCGDGAPIPLAVQAFLCRLDRFWADHLAFVEDVREGIHLERYAGRDPGLEYINRVGRAFEAGLEEVEQAVVADIAGGLTERAALERPSSTWTYQVDDTVPAHFNLSMIATSNIGAASIAAFPLFVVSGIGKLLVGLAKRISSALNTGFKRGRKGTG
jgi:preprotein translocase subunit SecA